MCVPHAGPQGIISQHPACHRLQQGGRAEEVTGGWRVEGGGWREITCWSHKSRAKGLPLGSRADFHVDTAGSGEWVAL